MSEPITYPQPGNYVTQLTPLQEMMFRNWYTNAIAPLGLNPNPDDPGHFYDYRGAWVSGVPAPTAEGGHWPSIYKHDDHPNRFVPFQGGLLDTKYDKFVPLPKRTIGK